jgi:hypothetical protein
MQEEQTINGALKDAISNTVTQGAIHEDISKHMEGFVRIDENGVNRGSYIPELNTLKSTISFLCDACNHATEWTHEAMNREFPGSANHPARYFKVNLAPMGLAGTESLLTVNDLSTSGDLASIRIREGAHGFELYINQSDDRLQKYRSRTNQAWIIIGPHARYEDKVMVEDFGVVVYTWFPGRMTAKMTPLNHCAVKI